MLHYCCCFAVKDALSVGFLDLFCVMKICIKIVFLWSYLLQKTVPCLPRPPESVLPLPHVLLMSSSQVQPAAPQNKNKTYQPAINQQKAKTHGRPFGSGVRGRGFRAQLYFLYFSNQQPKAGNTGSRKGALHSRLFQRPSISHCPFLDLALRNQLSLLITDITEE